MCLGLEWGDGRGGDLEEMECRLREWGDRSNIDYLLSVTLILLI